MTLGAGVEVLRELFKRQLDTDQLFFAAAEALAHLHHLMGQGKIRRRMDDDGVNVFESHEGRTVIQLEDLTDAARACLASPARQRVMASRFRIWPM